MNDKIPTKEDRLWYLHWSSVWMGLTSTCGLSLASYNSVLGQLLPILLMTFGFPGVIACGLSWNSPFRVSRWFCLFSNSLAVLNYATVVHAYLRAIA